VPKPKQKSFKTVNELKPGNYFGEIALLSHLKRTCSVFSVSSTVCAYTTKEQFQKLIKGNPDLETRLFNNFNYYKDNWTKFLKMMICNIRGFSELNPKTLSELIYKL